MFFFITTVAQNNEPTINFDGLILQPSRVRLISAYFSQLMKCFEKRGGNNNNRQHQQTNRSKHFSRPLHSRIYGKQAD